MSKHDRNTQIEQDRQNLESADLQSNPPEHARDGGRPAATADNKAAGGGRRRVVKANQAEAQTGSSGPNVDDLQRQDKPLK